MQTILYNQVEEGFELPAVVFGPVKHMDLVRYAGASGDFNPIHTDPKLAKEYGLDGTIAHGMYVMGQLGRVATNWANPRQIQNYNVKFRGMTLPGEKIICSGKVKKKSEKDGVKSILVNLEAANEQGEIKVSGDVTILAE